MSWHALLAITVPKLLEIFLFASDYRSIVTQSIEILKHFMKQQKTLHGKWVVDTVHLEWCRGRLRKTSYSAQNWDKWKQIVEKSSVSNEQCSPWLMIAIQRDYERLQCSYFSATVYKTVRPMLLDSCLSCPVLSYLSVCLSVCNVGVWVAKELNGSRWNLVWR